MSGILRFVIKRSVNQLRISSFKLPEGVLVNRSSACLNHLLNYQFQTNSTLNTANSIDKYIKKLDEDARRVGRLSLREVANVIDEIKSLRTATATQSLMIIRCCGSLIAEESPQKRTQLVQETWRIFEELGLRLDISHYNALLRVYLENEHVFKPTDILSELEEKGIEPNRVTYQRLITRYCENGDIEGATRILQIMREKEMPINEVVFNALVLGHSRANDMESAEGILNVMRQAGIDPSSETYTILITGYIKQGNLDKVNELLNHCEMHDISFSDTDYLEIALHLALHNHDINQVLSKVKRNFGYNQEAINYIYRLINANKLEEAYQVLKTMVRATRADGTLQHTGHFFVAALVRYNKTLDQILKYCDALTEENLNPCALNAAMEMSLKLGKEELSLNLFKAAKERNIPIRQHYFWPLIVRRAKEQGEGLFKLLTAMTTDFNMTVSTETLREYVIPHILHKYANIQSLVFDLKSCGVGQSVSVGSIALQLLVKGRLRDAAEIASSYRTYYPVYTIRRPLVNAYLKTSDADSFTTILRHIAAGIKWRAANWENNEKSEDEETDIPEHRESIGSIVADAVYGLKTNVHGSAKVEEILKCMSDKGIGISRRSAERIQNILQDKLTSVISTLLTKLSDDDLPAQEPVSGSGSFRSAQREVSVEALERLYETMKLKGESTKIIQKQLFNIYGRQHDLEKLMKLKEELEDQDYVFSGGMKAYLIDTLVESGKVDEALKTFQSYVEVEPDFNLHSSKILKLALALVEAEQYDEALKILSREALTVDANQTPENSNFLNSSLCWRLLNHFAEKGDENKLKEFFDLIIKKQYCNVNNILLGPLIKVHVVNDNFANAMKEFEQCCTKFRLTPWKNELTKKCIEKEDANNLQRITDLSTQIHGEVNSLYDLMLAFLESGRIRQAKKILETPGLRLRHDRLQNACQKYQNAGASEHLENLLTVTKNINSIDRSDLYYNLLLTYDKADEPQKALSLWTQMQEEDVQPTDAFLILLADVLNKHKLPVPFNVPESSPATRRVQENESRVEMSKTSREFRGILKNKSVDEALQYKNSKKPEEFNNTDLSLLMEGFLKEGKLEDSKKVLGEILARGTLPLTRVLKFHLIKALLDGDIESFEMIRPKLTNDQKRVLLFNSRLCTAFKKAGRIEEYLENLEKELDSTNTIEEVESFVKDLPKGTVIGILQEKPELLPRVQRIAEKCLERNSRIVAPLNIILMYHLLERNYAAADKLWKNYFLNADGPVAFKYATNYSVKNNDLEILQKLQSMMEQKSDVSPAALGIIYGGIIKVLVNKDQIEAAAAFLDEITKKVPISNIMRSSLETLKAACFAKRIPFKHEIPEYQKNQGHDSDSD